ncbi:MAG: peroxiredoxin family protein [Planctomycetes bacterium]|nr:peroxiredoxin family protein [Planctomycetota bacterium]
MIELGQLEKAHRDFASKNVRIVVISNDKLEDAKATQDQFQHLIVVSDAEQNITNAMKVKHVGAAPGGGDTNAPTTFLVDEKGYVSWHYRPENFMRRLSSDELLTAIAKVSPR